MPGIEAICPFCKKPLIPKCGNINMWHYAHKSNYECDTWKTGETDWHLSWKAKFPKSCVEVTIKSENSSQQSHRADVKLKSGVIIEFQNSHLSTDEITEREDFYKQMIWIINGNKFIENLILRYSRNAFTIDYEAEYCYITNTGISVPTLASAEILKNIGNPIGIIKKNILEELKYIPFNWKYYRKSWQVAKMPVMVDLNNGFLLWIKKINPSGIGYGRMIHQESLLKWSVTFKS